MHYGEVVIGNWKQELSMIKWKMSLSLSSSMCFAQIPLVKVRKIGKHLHFLRLTYVFYCYLLLFVKNVCFYKIVSLTKTKTPSLTITNTRNRFLRFFSIFLLPSLKKLVFYSWGARQLQSKFHSPWMIGGEIPFQSWPLLAFFFQLPHSAMTA